jgi:hypothetical protein
MSTDIQALRSALLDIARGSLGNSAKLLGCATDELERRETRIRRMEAILEEIKELAEDNYDGPEDTRWGAVLGLCRSGLA